MNLRPSKLKQTRICPGSTAYLDFTNYKSVSSIYAMEGTAAHALLEKVLRGKKSTQKFLGQYIKVLPNGGVSFLRRNAEPDLGDETVFQVTQEMIDSVDMAVDYVDNRLKEIGKSRGHLRLEERVNVFTSPDGDTIDGTADIVICNWPLDLEIVDFKYGRGVPVPAENNDQLRAYALGASKNECDDYGRVRYTIVQPRHPEGGVKSQIETMPSLLAYNSVLGDTVEAYKNSLSLLKAGANLQELYAADLISVGTDGSHCTFCELKVRCPAIREKALQLSGVPAEKPKVPADILQMLEIYEYSSIFKKWLDSIEEELIKFALTGVPIPRKKLVKNYGNRAWLKDLSEQDIIKILADRFSVDPENLIARKLISPTKAESFILPDLRKQFNDSLVVRPELKPKLVDADAKGEEYDMWLEAARDFID